MCFSYDCTQNLSIIHLSTQYHNMWEEDILQQLPVGSWFMTRLSVYRENVSNHWESVWIMFSFFSNFHSVERYFSVSPALNHSATSPFIPKQFFFFSLGCQARPPRLSVTFRVFQKCFILFMCWTRISCCPIQSLVGGSEEQKMYYYLLFEDCDSNLSGFGKECANINSDFYPGQ